METKIETIEELNKTVPSLNCIYFYLTEGCNLACRHCWLAPKLDKTGHDYPSLPLELFITAIKEAKPLGLTAVKLTGGEPLMHPDFSEMLETIKSEDLGLTIETNGVLCTPEIAAEIKKAKNIFVSVSLDGSDEETHEWMRGVSGSFNKAIDGIKNLVSAGLRPQVIFSVLKKNMHQVENIVDLAQELGAGSVKFNVVQPTARGEKLHESSDTLNITELVSLGYHIDRNLQPKSKIKLIFSFPKAFTALNAISQGSGCGMCGIFGIIGVIASGHYALCGIGQTVPDLIFGKVGEDPLEKVWKENAIINEIREKLPRQLDGICGRCLMKNSCLGFCIALNYYSSNGDLMAPFWFCRQAEDAGVFPNTRLASTR